MTITDNLMDDETLEDLQLQGLRLIQKKKGFRFGMDSVLLADFAQVRATDLVADFGCGSGILPLLMVGRNKGREYIGLEIQEQVARMAQRTMRMNHLENKVHIFNIDVACALDIISPCSMDAIICNPPYGMPGQVLQNQEKAIATARHQEQDTLSVFLSSAFQVLKGKGKIFLVYPAAQMFSLMTELHNHHLEPKHFRLVYPDAFHPANIVLLEAVKGAKPRLHPMSPLLIYEPDGNMTKEMKNIYHLCK